jgi:hypothetical protein
MTFVLISLIVAGLLVFLSQTSYARIAGEMYGYRDQMIAVALFRPDAGIPVIWISASAGLLLTADATIYLVNERRHDLSGRRDAIKRKWKSEKVFAVLTLISV